MIRALMVKWKRWLPALLVVELLCLLVAAGWTVHRRHAQQSAAAAPAPRVRPAEWPYTEASTADAPPQGRVTVPPVSFRTDHPPSDALDLRPVAPDSAAEPARRQPAARPVRSSTPEGLPPGTRALGTNGATVYYDSLAR